MKKANPILNATIPQKFLSSYLDAFPEMADSTAYEEYVEAVFEFMILNLFGLAIGQNILNTFNFLYLQSDWENGADKTHYYHNKNHAMQVTIRTVLLLNHYSHFGKIPNNCIAPQGEVNTIHSTSSYKMSNFQKEGIIAHFNNSLYGQEAALVLAAIFHDIGHTCGKSQDFSNIARALVKIEPFLCDIVKQFNYTETNYLAKIRSTASYIKSTEWPYGSHNQGIYHYIIRAADLLSMTQHDWLQVCYFSLSNEMIHNKQQTGFNDVFIRHVLGQCNFINSITNTLNVMKKSGFENIGTFINGSGLVKCAWPLFHFKDASYWEELDGPVNLLHMLFYRAFMVKATLSNDGVLMPGVINPIAVKNIVETYSLVYTHCHETNDFTFLSSEIKQQLFQDYETEKSYWSRDLDSEV